jgi:AP-1 complex subunit mu
MAGAVSAVHVLSTAGKLLISRDFRGDVPSACVDRFLSLVLDAETETELKPVMYDEGLTYTYVTHNNLYLLAVSRANVNAVATLYFLHRLVDVFTHYFEARRRQRVPCA